MISARAYGEASPPPARVPPIDGRNRGLVAASTDSGACTTARSDEKVSIPERAGLPRPSTRSLLIGKSRFRGIPHTPIMLGNSEEEVARLVHFAPSDRLAC